MDRQVCISLRETAGKHMWDGKRSSSRESSGKGTVSLRSLESLSVCMGGCQPRVVRHAVGARARGLAHGSGVESGRRTGAGVGRRTESIAAWGRQEVFDDFKGGKRHREESRGINRRHSHECESADWKKADICTVGSGRREVVDRWGLVSGCGLGHIIFLRPRDQTFPHFLQTGI